MSRSLYSLDTIQVASPCAATWEMMHGNDQVRFCSQCRRHVYNLSALPNLEAVDELVQRTEGRLCVRFYRRADGKLLTGDCPVGLRNLRRKLVVAVALVASLFLAILTWAAGETMRQAQRGPMSVLRDMPPFRIVMEWLDPTPCMGEALPGVPIAPPPQQPDAPPDADIPPD